MSGWNFQNASSSGPQVSTGPELDEITTNALGFQALAGETKIRLLPQPWPEDSLPPTTASLLSIASKKGLLAAAGPDTLVIAYTDAVRKAYHGAAPAESNVKPFTPQTSIQLPRLSQVAFSADETCLAISAENGGGLNIYDVDALLQGKQDPAFQMATNGTPVRALLPNPAPEFAHLFAVVLTDGKLMVANLKEQQFSNVFRDGVSCVSWSAKGKQLVAGLQDGSAAQYDPQGNQKAQIPKPPEITDALPMTSICWVTNDEFLTIHTPVSGDTTDSTYHFMCRDKASGAFTAKKLSGDPCPAFGMSRIPAHHFISRLRQFPPALDEVLILSSTAAVDIGVITKASVSLAEDDMASDSAVNNYTTTGMADDTRRAQMPMSAGDGMGDTSPIGMALDLSSKDPVVKPIPQEEMEESATPAPALMVLNNEGLLSTWWFIYNESVRQKTVYPGLVAASSTSTPAAQPAAQPGPFGSSATVPSAFGSSAQAPPSFGSSGFSKPAQPTFGSTSFGKPAAPAFGSPATPGGFGGASALGSKPSPWGSASVGDAAQGATPAFGKPTFGSATTIGGASGSSGGFGAASGLGNKASPWGTPASSQSAAGPTFGQSSTPFGSSATSGASGFAALAAKSSDKPAFASTESKPSLQSPFSSFGNSNQTSASPFGAVSAATDKKPSVFSSFGQASDKPMTTPQPSFGSTVTLPSTTGGSFGAASTIGAKPSPWSSPAPVQPSAPAQSTKEEAMSDDDESDDESGKSSQETAKPDQPKSFFGQPSKPAQQSPFGQLGGDKPKTSIFAQSTDKAGESPKSSPFAQQPSKSLFGQPSDKPATSIFGQPTKPSTSSIFGQPSESSSGKPAFSGFKLGSTFKGDGSAKDDLPASSDTGKSLFGSGFGNILGEAAKDTPKEPETPIKEEPGTDEPTLQNISTTPVSPPKAQESGKADKEAVSPEDAPLPPDFTTFKPKPVEEDLPPIAGSPPVDLGDKSQLSSPVSSVGGEDDDEDQDDDEEDEDDEDEDEEDEDDEDDEGDEEEIDGPADEDDESWADEDDEDDDDEDGPDQDDTVSRPPRTEAANAFGSRLSFPTKPAASTGTFTVPSTTPAGLPKAPIFPPPTKQRSPRSPSPMRPDRSTGAPPARSTSHTSIGKQPLTVPSMGVQPNSRPSSAALKQPPQPIEPEAGELSDDEDIRIRELLDEPPEPTKNLGPFVAHQDYIGQVTKPGIGGQIEKVYRDINSMIDTLGLNARSLQAFVKGHETLYKEGGRKRSDLEDAEDWCLVEIGELGVVEKELGDSLESGKVDNVKGKIMDLNELYKESTRLRARTAEMRKQISARTDPQQRAQHRAAALNTEAQVQQTELRQGVAKVQVLLQEAEEALSVLRADLASIPATANGTSPQRVPTVEAVTNTIMKMTAMIEQKSGDVDVLEAQIRRLPQGLASLSLEDEPDLMRSSVRSLNGRGAASVHGTPPSSRSRLAASTTTPLGMSGMFGSSRFQTPQVSRRSQSTYGFSYSPEDSGDLRSSVRSLNGSTRKKMADVSPEEVKRYLAKQEQRRKVLTALKQTVQKRGTRVTNVEK